MLGLDAVLAELKARQLNLQEEVFVAPPKTFEEFNQRLGRWLELEENIAVFQQKAKVQEDEQ